MAISASSSPRVMVRSPPPPHINHHFLDADDHDPRNNYRERVQDSEDDDHDMIEEHKELEHIQQLRTDMNRDTEKHHHSTSIDSDDSDIEIQPPSTASISASASSMPFNPPYLWLPFRTHSLCSSQYHR